MARFALVEPVIGGDVVLRLIGQPQLLDLVHDFAGPEVVGNQGVVIFLRVLTVLMAFGIHFCEMYKEEERPVLVPLEQLDGAAADFFVQRQTVFVHVHVGLGDIKRLARDYAIFHAVFDDDCALGLFLRRFCLADFGLFRRIGTDIACFADHGNRDKSARAEMRLQPLEDCQALRNRLIVPIGVYAGHFRVVAGKNLGPSGLGRGVTLDVNLDVRAPVN